MLYGLVGILLLLLLLSSTSSIALRRMTRARFVELSEGIGREEELERLMSLREELVHVTDTLRTVCVIALVLLTLYLLEGRETTGAVAGQALFAIYASAFVLASLMVLIVSVGLGNAWARYRGDAFLARVLPVLYGVRHVLAPLLAVLEWGDRLVRRLAGVSPKVSGDDADELERGILEAVSEGEVGGVVDEVEKDMITSVIELRETVVAEIMTPRTEMVALEKGASLEQARRLIAAEGHSRIPVYDGTVDHILGILYAKDILRLGGDDAFLATDVMRQAFFIPETKLLKELLHEFRRAKVHMAVVLDEYGGTSGLVTIEDILEEVVGEIADEYEPEEPAALQRLDEHTLQADARIPIYELNKELPVPLPESDNYETLGGFILTTLGMVPQVGARMEHQGVELQVTEAEPRRIKRVVIRLPKVPAVAE